MTLLLAWAGGDFRWLAVGGCVWVWCFALGRLGICEALKQALGVGLTLLAALVTGLQIEWVRTWDGQYWALGWLSFPLTAAWVILIAGALRFVHRQGTGRLVLQVGWIASFALWVISLLQAQPRDFPSLLSFLVWAALGLALWRRWELPQVASQGIGVLLAFIGIGGMAKTSATLALLAPMLILGLPPLTFRHALGVIPLRIQRQGPHQLLALYAGFSALSVVLVAWSQHPGWAPLAVGAGGLSILLLWALTFNPETVWQASARQVRLFGVPFRRMSFDEALWRIEGFIHTRRPHLVFTPDTTALMRTKSDPDFLSCYRAADLLTPDGTGIVWASRWLGAPLPERVTGIDLVSALCRTAAQRGYRVYLLGARPGVVEQAAGRLKQDHDGLTLVGTQHGFFPKAQTPKVLARIKAAAPDILLVGLGAPYQEKWLVQHKQALGVPVMMGVGGSFDVLAGQLRRAPLWMQRAGLEWLYRVYLEPQRFVKALQIPHFLCHIVRLKGCLWARRLYTSMGSTTSASSSCTFDSPSQSLRPTLNTSPTSSKYINDSR